MVASRLRPRAPATHGWMLVSDLMALPFSQANPGVYLSWGVFGIQLGNLVIIIVMLVLFVLAIVLPFPGSRRRK